VLGLGILTLLALGPSSLGDYIVPSFVHIKHLDPLLYKDLFAVVQAHRERLVDMVDTVLDTQALVE
jgi:hypothetical protein